MKANRLFKQCLLLCLGAMAQIQAVKVTFYNKLSADWSPLEVNVGAMVPQQVKVRFKRILRATIDAGQQMTLDIPAEATSVKLRSRRPGQLLNSTLELSIANIRRVYGLQVVVVGASGHVLQVRSYTAADAKDAVKGGIHRVTDAAVATTKKAADSVADVIHGWTL